MQADAQELEVVDEGIERIQAAVREAVASRDLAMATIEDGIRRCIAAGELLNAQRKIIAPRNWMAWVETNLPEISYRTAFKWMKLALVAKSVLAKVESASTIRQAYLLAGLLPESEPAENGGASPSWLIQLVRAERAIQSQLTPEAIETLGKADREALKDRLKPFVEMYRRLEAA